MVTREQNSEQWKKWYSKNRERYLTKRKGDRSRSWKAWYSSYSKEYQAKRKEKGDYKRWARDNPDKVSAKNARRCAAKNGSEGEFTDVEWKELCRKHDGKCLKCRETKRLTPDHIIPLSKGGNNTIGNIQPLCSSCNSGKKDRIIDYR